MKQTLSEDDLEKVLKGIADFLFEVDEVQSSLQQHFDKMLKLRTGARVTLLGPPGSGKHSVIRRFVNAQTDKLCLIEHNASFDDVITAKARLRELEELLEKKNNVCYVIYNFQKFKGKFGNNALYTLAQRVKSSPLLLILAGESQEGITVFEKRIASRMASNILPLIPKRTPKNCWNFLREMLKYSTKDLPKDLRNLFDLPAEVPVNFYLICRFNPVYGLLKLLAKDLVDTHFDLNGERDPSDIIHDLIKERMSEDRYSELASQVTDRQFGLLMAAAIKTERLRLFFPSKYLYSEYKRFVNVKGIPDRSNLYLSERNFDSDLADLIYKKFFGAKYQGSRVIMICWNINPLLLFEPKIKEKFISKLSHYLEERADPNFKNLRL